MCLKCVFSHRRAQARYREKNRELLRKKYHELVEKRRASGLCIRCGQPMMEEWAGRAKCSDCVEESYANY